MPDRSLAQIAADLYSGPVEDFVQTRNARAAEVDDRDLAARIRRLKKPSRAAWVVNVFASERRAELAQALQLAEELREAQADLDAAALAKLGRQRRALTDRLADQAAEVASARGGPVTAATREAVRQTIAAAFFDPGAGAAVASGRLVRELEPSGAFPLDLDAVVGGGHPETAPAVTPPVDELKARRERRRAERAVHDAEQGLARAQRAHDEADAAIQDTSRLVDRLTAKESELESQLAGIRQQLRRAEADVPALEERRAAAEAAVAESERGLEAARRALQRVSAVDGTEGD